MKKSNPYYRLLREIGEIILALAVAWFGYQFLALVTGTQLPIVAVVSDSMYHSNEFDAWWENRGQYYGGIGITKDEFSKYPVPSGLSRGDLLFVLDKEPRIGDVVIYQRNGQPYTIVHRVVSINDGTITTKGDNNANSDPAITKTELEGTVAFAVPLLGYPRFALYYFGI